MLHSTKILSKVLSLTILYPFGSCHALSSSHIIGKTTSLFEVPTQYKLLQHQQHQQHQQPRQHQRNRIQLSLSSTSFFPPNSSNFFHKSRNIVRIGKSAIQMNTKQGSANAEKVTSVTTLRGGGMKHKTQLSAQTSNQDNNEESSILQYTQIILPLLFVYISNQWSRSSLYYLVDFSDNATPETAMNVALQFSEGQYGALASVAFTALFAIASLFAGNLADKSNRKQLTIYACLAWSVATGCTALAGGYTQVLLARIAMGLACAFATPSAYTLIRDLIPKSRAALASSLYGSGVYLGGALSSLSILLDQNFGWRIALGCITLFGVISAALSFLVLPKDPTFESKSIESSKSQTENPLSGLTSLISDSSSILESQDIKLLFLASFLRFCSGLSIAVWAAPYFRLAFPDSASSYALINASIVSICGVVSGIAGGALSDYAGAQFESRGKSQNVGRMLIPIIGSFLAVPAWYFCIHAESFQVSMIWLAVEYLVAECWFGPVVAVLQSSVKKEQGGTAQGLFTLTGAIGNFAPSILGILYGMKNELALTSSNVILSDLLGWFVCGGYFFSAVVFSWLTWGLNTQNSASTSGKDA